MTDAPRAWVSCGRSGAIMPLAYAEKGRPESRRVRVRIICERDFRLMREALRDVVICEEPCTSGGKSILLARLKRDAAHALGMVKERP